MSNFIFKNKLMEHKKELEDLHKKSLDKIDEYLKNKKNLTTEHHEKFNEVKSKWQNSWTDFMDFLMYLETVEI